MSFTCDLLVVAKHIWVCRGDTMWGCWTMWLSSASILPHADDESQYCDEMHNLDRDAALW
jgi:hypothetical protein